MNRVVIVAVAALMLSAFSVRAEETKKAEGKKAAAERLWARGPELEKLKADLSLTDEQIARLKEAVAAVEKKNTEVTSKDAVKTAEAEVQKAKDALKAAEDKMKTAADDWDVLEERKKAVYSALPEDKREKAQEVIHYRPKAEKKEKKEEKKADAK